MAGSSYDEAFVERVVRALNEVGLEAVIVRTSVRKPRRGG
jgi:hypothetical protein